VAAALAELCSRTGVGDGPEAAGLRSAASSARTSPTLWTAVAIIPIIYVIRASSTKVLAALVLPLSGSWDAQSCLRLPFRSKLRKELAAPYAEVGDTLPLA